MDVLVYYLCLTIFPNYTCLQLFVLVCCITKYAPTLQVPPLPPPKHIPTYSPLSSNNSTNVSQLTDKRSLKTLHWEKTRATVGSIWDLPHKQGNLSRYGHVGLQLLVYNMVYSMASLIWFSYLSSLVNFDETTNFVGFLKLIKKSLRACFRKLSVGGF